MKLRWKILIGVGIFIVLMAASLSVTMHVQPANELEAYKKSLRDKGEKLEISEVLPPSVPDESNGVALVESAFHLFVPSDEEYSNLPPAMMMIAPGKAMVCWAQSNLVETGQGGYTNSWENAEAAVEANLPAIDLLSQAANYPAIDFHLDYAKGREMLLKHLAPFRRCSLRLSAEAMCDLHEGDAASATTNICVLLALIQDDHDERVPISQLVRIVMTSTAASASWELLQSTNVTDPELAALEKSWEHQEFIEGAENSLLMDRAITEATIKGIRDSPDSFNRLADFTGFGGSGDWFDSLDGFWNHARMAGAMIMWQTSWSYSDELQALKGDQIILEAVRTVKTNQFFNPVYSNMLSQLDAMGITNAPDDWLTKLDIPDYRRIFSDANQARDLVVVRTMTAETCRRVVVTAIALKRFQLKHGNFPDELSELTPAFLPSAPLDPVDGKPLRYRRNTDGTFVLYSVGDNGVDDGGNPTNTVTRESSLYWQDHKARDWVWPQPATPAEVENFYEHPPK